MIQKVDKPDVSVEADSQQQQSVESIDATEHNSTEKSKQHQDNQSNDTGESTHKSEHGKKVLVAVAAVLVIGAGVAYWSQSDHLSSNGSASSEPSAPASAIDGSATDNKDSATDSNQVVASSEQQASTADQNAANSDDKSADTQTTDTPTAQPKADTADSATAVVGNDNTASTTTDKPAEQAANVSPADTNDTNKSEQALLLQKQQDQIDALNAKLAQAQAKAEQVQKQEDKVNQLNGATVVVNDVSRLVQMANSELSISGNLPNALNALNTAQSTLNNAKNPLLAGLLGAVTSDIVTLKSTPVINSGDLFNSVSQLTTLVDSAPFISSGKAPDLTLLAKNSETTELPWYSALWTDIKALPAKTWTAIKSDMGGLVRVEKVGNPDAYNLDQEQILQVRQSMKVNLQFAQQSLLNGQQAVWQSSIELVQQSAAKYLDPEAEKTQQLLAALKQLHPMSVRPQMPELQQSMKAIEETRAQIEKLSKE